jgi:CRP/FNR family transcriptional regulator, cyclic AMP receptor protein
MKGIPVKQGLLSELQGQLSADLFASATPVRRAADDVLFVAGDAGNGCYRVEDGLVKVTMMSRAGVERI